MIAMILALAACAGPGPAGSAPPAHHDAPERGGDGGGGMM